MYYLASHGQEIARGRGKEYGGQGNEGEGAGTKVIGRRGLEVMPG